MEVIQANARLGHRGGKPLQKGLCDRLHDWQMAQVPDMSRTIRTQAKKAHFTK